MRSPRPARSDAFSNGGSGGRLTYCIDLLVSEQQPNLFGAASRVYRLVRFAPHFGHLRRYGKCLKRTFSSARYHVQSRVQTAGGS